MVIETLTHKYDLQKHCFPKRQVKTMVTLQTHNFKRQVKNIFYYHWNIYVSRVEVHSAK